MAENNLMQGNDGRTSNSNWDENNTRSNRENESGQQRSNYDTTGKSGQNRETDFNRNQRGGSYGNTGSINYGFESDDDYNRGHYGQYGNEGYGSSNQGYGQGQRNFGQNRGNYGNTSYNQGYGQSGNWGNSGYNQGGQGYNQQSGNSGRSSYGNQEFGRGYGDMNNGLYGNQSYNPEYNRPMAENRENYGGYGNNWGNQNTGYGGNRGNMNSGYSSNLGGMDQGYGSDYNRGNWRQSGGYGYNSPGYHSSAYDSDMNRGRRNMQGNYDNERGGSYGRGFENDYYNGRNERNWWDRTADEVSSWFGDSAAERRRNMDRQQEGMHRGRGPRGYQRSDERIKEDINDRLSDDSYVDATDVDVQVTGGEVILTGSVESRSAKRRAEDLAEAISGVRNVENRIRVNQQSENSRSTGSSTYTGANSTNTTTGTTGDRSNSGTGSTTSGKNKMS